MASRATRHHVDQRSSHFRRCDSQKVGYPSYDLALSAAELMMLAGKVSQGCHITPYQCDRCGEWHVANRVIVFLGKGQRS